MAANDPKAGSSAERPAGLEPERESAVESAPGPCAEPASELNSGLSSKPSIVPAKPPPVGPRPLEGRTIVVTRSREQASALSLRLTELGANVIEIPTIAIVPPRSYEVLDQALRELSSYDWLLVTSANTVRVLVERLGVLELAASNQPRTVAVGPSTAAALEQAGFRVDLVPQPAVAESVLAAIRDKVRGRRVLLVRAEVARDLLPEGLHQAGAEVTIAEAYRTVAADSEGQVAEVFGARDVSCEKVNDLKVEFLKVKDLKATDPKVKIDALTFTSSSTVKNLVALLHRAEADWPRGALVFSIGPVTSATLRECGVEPSREATQHDVEGLVAAVLEGFT